MTGPFTLAQTDGLVTRSHSDGVTDLVDIVGADNGTRTFVFSTTVDQSDNVYRAGDVPHRWIDNITISLSPRTPP
ncbi:hypothetical protein JCM4814A_80820 [Streptomyces phaeofaciens JCM 4814]|uniref:Uncharacterized protein n=1 Tax=Streptomyces phaeofaciens TaxID=68254 RepID=A0A918HRP2_9ACTN|nr:hypothetical protein [Streptomyces phaeofaciens]GGT95467.1 hypothetical protein GCM10010226_86440 [Streptomyces phaeofaciens]